MPGSQVQRTAQARKARQDKSTQLQVKQAMMQAHKHEKAGDSDHARLARMLAVQIAEEGNCADRTGNNPPVMSFSTLGSKRTGSGIITRSIALLSALVSTVWAKGKRPVPL